MARPVDGLPTRVDDEASDIVKLWEVVRDRRSACAWSCPIREFFGEVPGNIVASRSRTVSSSCPDIGRDRRGSLSPSSIESVRGILDWRGPDVREVADGLRRNGLGFAFCTPKEFITEDLATEFL
jgi:hypothetical protein